MSGFAALAAAGIGAAATIGSKLIPGASSGSGGSAQNQNSSTSTDYTTGSVNHGTTATSYDPQFTAATSGLISQATANAATPYSQSSAFFNPTQLDAFWGVKNNPNLSHAAQAAQTGYFNQAGQYNPYAAAQPFLDQGSGFLGQGQGFLNQAAGVPNGYTAAQPYANMATGSFTGDNVSRYMDPYLSGALESNNRVANQNLQQNLLPTLNSQFIGSGGGARAGNNAYSTSMNGVLNNWENNLNASNALATNSAYGIAGQNFQADQNRYAGLAGTMGGVANSALGAYGNLANSAFGGANSSWGGANSAASAADASNRDFTSLGSAEGAAALNNYNIGAGNNAALLGIGNQLQATDQKNINDQKEWPFQTSQYLDQILKDVRVPTTVTSNSEGQTTGHQTSNTVGTNTGSSSSSPSALGTGLGTAAGVNELLKGVDWNKIFGSGAQNGTSPDGTPTLPDGTPITDAKRGGHFSDGRMKQPRFARGGFLGMDAGSSPAFATNAGYWGEMRPRSWSDPTGRVGGYYAAGGDVAGGRTKDTSGDDDFSRMLALAAYFQGQSPPASGFNAPVVDKSMMLGSTTSTPAAQSGIRAPGAFGGFRRGGHFAAGGLATLDPDSALKAALMQAAARQASPPPAAASPGWFTGAGSDNGSTGAAVGSVGDSGGISGTGETYRRGGFLKFAAGGVAPVVKATRVSNDRLVAGARARAKTKAAGVTRQLALPGSGAGFFR